MKYKILKDILDKMEEFYAECGSRDLAYTYGFFDAVFIVREMLEGSSPSDTNRQSVVIGQSRKE